MILLISSIIVIIVLKKLIDSFELEIKDNLDLLTFSSKMATIGELSGSVAHEINSPLMAITAYFTSIKRQISKDLINKELVLEKIEKGQETVSKINKIITGIRSFSTMSSTQPFKPVNLSKVINDAIDLSIYKAKKNRVMIINNCPEDKYLIHCHDVQIIQVFVNLLNNSIDATAKLNDKWIKIEVFELVNFIKISFIDSGLGLTKNVEEKILKTFFTTKEYGKGTGLGLSISKRIIEQHKGTLTYSGANINTTFDVLLPK